MADTNIRVGLQIDGDRLEERLSSKPVEGVADAFSKLERKAGDAAKAANAGSESNLKRKARAVDEVTKSVEQLAAAEQQAAKLLESLGKNSGNAGAVWLAQQRRGRTYSASQQQNLAGVSDIQDTFGRRRIENAKAYQRRIGAEILPLRGERGEEYRQRLIASGSDQARRTELRRLSAEQLYLREQKRRASRGVPVEGASSESVAIAREAAAKEAQQLDRLRNKLGAFAEPVLAGESYADIAKATGASKSTVGRKVLQAKQDFVEEQGRQALTELEATLKQPASGPAGRGFTRPAMTGGGGLSALMRAKKSEAEPFQATPAEIAAATGRPERIVPMHEPPPASRHFRDDESRALILTPTGAGAFLGESRAPKPTWEDTAAGRKWREKLARKRAIESAPLEPTSAQSGYDRIAELNAELARNAEILAAEQRAEFKNRMADKMARARAAHPVAQAMGESGVEQQVRESRRRRGEDHIVPTSRSQAAAARQLKLDRMQDEQLAEARRRSAQQRGEEEALRARMRARRTPEYSWQQPGFHREEARERLERMRAGRGGWFGQNRGQLGALGREVSILGSQFGLPYVGLGMGGMATGVGLAGAGAYLAYQRHEQESARMEESRQAAIAPAVAIRTMRMNFDFPDLPGFEQRLRGSAERWGIGMQDAALAAATALSSAGGLPLPKIEGALKATMALMPGDPDAQQAVTGFIMDLTKIAAARGQDIDAKTAAGFFVQLQRAGKSVSPAETARYSGQAISTMAQANPRDSIAFLARINAATTQMAIDTHGRTSRTGDIRLSEALRDWKPTGELAGPDAIQRFLNADTMQSRLAALQASPELQQEFWKSHDFEASVKVAIEAMVNGSDLFTAAMRAATEQIGELTAERAQDYDAKVKQVHAGEQMGTDDADRYLKTVFDNMQQGNKAENRMATAKKFVEEAGQKAGFWAGRRWMDDLSMWTGMTPDNAETVAIEKMGQYVLDLYRSNDVDKQGKIEAINKLIANMQQQLDQRLGKPTTGKEAPLLPPDLPNTAAAPGWGISNPANITNNPLAPRPSTSADRHPDLELTPQQRLAKRRAKLLHDLDVARKGAENQSSYGKEYRDKRLRDAEHAWQEFVTAEEKREHEQDAEEKRQSALAEANKQLEPWADDEWYGQGEPAPEFHDEWPQEQVAPPASKTAPPLNANGARDAFITMAKRLFPGSAHVPRMIQKYDRGVPVDEILKEFDTSKSDDTTQRRKTEFGKWQQNWGGQRSAPAPTTTPATPPPQASRSEELDVLKQILVATRDRPIVVRAPDRVAPSSTARSLDRGSPSFANVG